MASQFGSKSRGGGAARKSAESGARPGFWYSVTRKLQLLGVVLLVLLLVLSVLIYRNNRSLAENAAYVVTAGELRMLSQRMAKAASQALRGGPAAFIQLRDSQRKFELNLNRLRNGGELSGRTIPRSPPDVAPQLDGIATKWEIVSRDVTELEKMEMKIAVFGKYLRGFNTGGDRVFFPVRDGPTQLTVTRLENAFDDYRMAVGDLLSGMQDMDSAGQAGIRVVAFNERLLDAADELIDAYHLRNDGQQRTHERALAALIVLVLAVLAVMFSVYANDVRRQFALQAEQAERQAEQAERQAEQAEQAEKLRRESEKVNRQNQDAILRLMNELGDLADGDLTVTATVSEDITGAIADSINYTIEELRVLVGRINNAASRVTAATEIAQRTSTELLSAAQRQSQEIQNAGHSVLEVASSMARVSNDAEQSAQVARQSLTVADKGAQAVQDSIKGMDEIRAQIQESAKRIKRLGESSQEIGEIVELISDITEQTNVLALNAAIQAASAGDAGRGFTVVAEEVQRLAERSGEATKQIAAIVKTIQSDTQGAISAMEESTRGVVQEAKLSDAAGQALAEIGAVSQNLAELIERISGSTRRQAEAARGVAGKMQSILKVTEQTTEGTQRTASAVGELAGLATELKGSVAGFKAG
ncbi:MAG: methyl-accepting chemotaxis protein [Candidatus Accumulibacter sp.]|nr:methyl-accepting chemotaxis protein [Accumulibacter sp.]